MTQGILKQFKDSKVHLIKKINQDPNIWKKYSILQVFQEVQKEKILVVIPVAE